MFRIEEWLRDEGVSFDWVNDKNISFTCPFCGKGKGHFTISVDYNKPLFNCYKCGASGSWEEIVAVVAGVNRQEAERIVSSFSLPVFHETKAEPILHSSKPSLPTPAGWTIEAREYLEKRGISRDVASYLGMYYTREGKYRNRVVIPVYDHKGNTVSFQARTVGETVPKYLSPPSSTGMGIKNFVYSPNRRLELGRKVYLVEGVFDAIKMAFVVGAKKVCAVFGKTVGREQKEVLQRQGVEQVVLCFDPDAVRDVERMWIGLSGSFDVGVSLLLENGKDPADMTPDEIRVMTKDVSWSILEFGMRRVNALKRENTVNF